MIKRKVLPYHFQVLLPLVVVRDQFTSDTGALYRFEKCLVRS